MVELTHPLKGVSYMPYCLMEIQENEHHDDDQSSTTTTW